ncbi:hypothetical protein D3C87_1798670 [compost metagenome]
MTDDMAGKRMASAPTSMLPAEVRRCRKGVCSKASRSIRKAVSTTCFSEFATMATFSVRRVRKRHRMIMIEVAVLPWRRGQEKTSVE